MRIKLSLEDFPLFEERKICFLFNTEKCKKVADLCYLIKTRYYRKQSTVMLYLDDYYVPPTEDISIIKEEDILMVRLDTNKPAAHFTSDSVTSVKRKTISLSSSSSDEEDKRPASKKVKFQKKENVSAKKIVPLSQLGIKKIKTSSSSDSSSSDSETDSEADNKKTKKKIANKNTVKSLTKSEFKRPIALTNMNLNKNKTKSTAISNPPSSSSSSSSSASSSSSSSDENELMKSRSTVDFNVSSLCKAATSTPFPTPPSRVLATSSAATKSPTPKRKEQNDNSKKIAEKDVYTNISEIYLNRKRGDKFTFDQSLDEKKKIDKKAFDTEALAAKPESIDSKTLKDASNTVEVNGQSASLLEEGTASFQSENSLVKQNNQPSGKTLRNRRRRQKKLQSTRNSKLGKKNDESMHQESNEIESVVKVEENNNLNNIVTRDYSAYPALTGPPVKGTVIAYKILELSQSYTPELSDYKEAIVNNYEEKTQELELKLSSASLQSVRGDGNVSNRFSIEDEDENDNAQSDVVTVNFNELKEIRLIL